MWIWIQSNFSWQINDKSVFLVNLGVSTPRTSPPATPAVPTAGSTLAAAATSWARISSRATSTPRSTARTSGPAWSRSPQRRRMTLSSSRLVEFYEYLLWKGKNCYVLQVSTKSKSGGKMNLIETVSLINARDLAYCKLDFIWKVKLRIWTCTKE